MKDYTKMLALHNEKYIGENDLFLEIFEGEGITETTKKRPPLLLVHGAYTGSWMWSKYIPHFISNGWKCYAMNMRSHYKSRVMDMTQVTFEDYLDDIKEAIAECGEAPIIIGFSLGGILCQKLAETVKLAGLILIDSCISKEVNEIAPYKSPSENTIGMIMPAPTRGDIPSIDESVEDIAFQIKYLSMESSKAIIACACWIKGIEGIAIDRSVITCPSLVIKSVSCDEDDRRGEVEANHLNAEYEGFWDTTHTGLLVGQKYLEVVDRIIDWLKRL
jgi:hypothetical protein